MKNRTKNLIDFKRRENGVLQAYLITSFYIAWLFIFVILFFSTVKQYEHKLFIITLTIIFYGGILGFVLRYRRIMDGLSNRIVCMVIFSALLLMLILLLVSGCAMCIAPFNDTGSTYYAAAEVLQHGHISTEINQYTSCYWATHTSNHDYFLIYPNNLFLVFYQVCYYKILSFFLPVDMYSVSGYHAAVLLNSLSIVSAVGCGVFTAKKCRGNCGAILFLLFSVLFIPYYLHAYKAYSDTLSMPYMSAALFCFVLSRKTGSFTISSFQNVFLCGFFLVLGILIKGSALILLVAFIICLILQSRPLKQKLMELTLLSLTVLVLLNSWSVYKDNCSWIDTSRADELEIPSIHWIMMASVGSGGYRQSDFDYTQSYPDLAQKKAAVLEEFLRRVKSYGSCSDFLQFEIQKVAAVLADGKYAQKEHLELTFSSAPGLSNWVSEEGEYYDLFYCYITIFITLFYFSILISILLRIFTKKTLHIDMLFQIIIFGSYLFFSFWEFKSRYLLNFVPVYMLILVFSWIDWERFLSGKKRF